MREEREQEARRQWPTYEECQLQSEAGGWRQKLILVVVWDVAPLPAAILAAWGDALNGGSIQHKKKRLNSVLYQAISYVEGLLTAWCPSGPTVKENVLRS